MLTIVTGQSSTTERKKCNNKIEKKKLSNRDALTIKKINKNRKKKLTGQKIETCALFKKNTKIKKIKK